MLDPIDLKKAFPWIGTDEEVDGADVVDQLSELYEQLEAERLEEEPIRQKFVALALQHPDVREGELEVDESAIISAGDDEGAYVQAWLWVANDTDEEAEDEAK